MSSGLLLAFPLESVAVRLALALGLALGLLRIVSRWDLRSPRARTVLAGSPFVVAAAVVAYSIRDLGIPSLLVPSSETAGALALPVADRYLDFAPMGPVLLGVWAVTSLLLMARRIVHAASFRDDVLANARPAEPRIAALVVRISRRLDVTPPRVLLTRGAVGGAAVIGVRDPIVLLDEEVLFRLDPEELEGVLAHELAHVARRDNLLAWAAAFIRDVTFFVPGSGWAVRALHREREAAADQDAVEVTRRPAALASGLLSVVERAAGARRVPHGCAALVPDSSIVDRVQMLLSDSSVSLRRHRSELALAAAVSLLAVAVAVIVPGQFTGERGEREALGVLVGSAPAVQTADPAAHEGRVFDVYRRVGALTTGSEAPVAPRVRGDDLFGAEDRPGIAIACSTDGSTCPNLGRVTGLVLRPQPIVLVEDGMSARWQATPVVGGASSERLGFYWLARLAQGEPLAR